MVVKKCLSERKRIKYPLPVLHNPDYYYPQSWVQFSSREKKTHINGAVWHILSVKSHIRERSPWKEGVPIHWKVPCKEESTMICMFAMQRACFWFGLVFVLRFVCLIMWAMPTLHRYKADTCFWLQWELTQRVVRYLGMVGRWDEKGTDGGVLQWHSNKGGFLELQEHKLLCNMDPLPCLQAHLLAQRFCSSSHEWLWGWVGVAVLYRSSSSRNT